MIQIRFEDNGGCIGVTAKGHAGYAPKGQDVVCAAFSALMVTLAAQVLDLKEQGYFREEPEVKLEDGAAVIRCHPRSGCKGITKKYFEMIEGGCVLMEMDYGSFVDVTTFEGGKRNGN